MGGEDAGRRRRRRRRRQRDDPTLPRAASSVLIRGSRHASGAQMTPRGPVAVFVWRDAPVRIKWERDGRSMGPAAAAPRCTLITLNISGGLEQKGAGPFSRSLRSGKRHHRDRGTHRKGAARRCPRATGPIMRGGAACILLACHRVHLLLMACISLAWLSRRPAASRSIQQLHASTSWPPQASAPSGSASSGAARSMRRCHACAPDTRTSSCSTGPSMSGFGSVVIRRGCAPGTRFLIARRTTRTGRQASRAIKTTGRTASSAGRTGLVR